VYLDQVDQDVKVSDRQVPGQQFVTLALGGGQKKPITIIIYKQ